MTICEGFSVGQSVGRQERRWGQTEGGEVWSLSDQVRDFGLYPEIPRKTVMSLKPLTQSGLCFFFQKKVTLEAEWGMFCGGSQGGGREAS